MALEKYGFVYIWRDRKHKRFYIGSHWGSETDGYVCSSTWMKNSFKRRPGDFARKTLSRVQDRSLLLDEEHRWLSMIRTDELGTRYYNLTKHKPGHWSTASDTRSVRQKISDAHRSNPNWGAWLIGTKQTDEHRRKHSEAKKGKRMSPTSEFKPGHVPWSKGTKGAFVVSEETKQRISEANRGRVVSEETRQKIRGHEVSTETRDKIRAANIGKTHSDESKHKMSKAHTGKVLSEETKKKIGNASRGHTLSIEARKKISEAQKGVNNDPRSVHVEYDGIVYDSYRSAAKLTGKSYHYIRKHGKKV